MGWTPMGPDLDTCGMTNWVGSFDPIMFIYFMLATVLIPYPVYVVVATVFNWEHLAKRPARHYQDLLHATSYGVIVFIFGNYARTLNWITVLAFWITWPCYSMIAELDFAKTSLPSWKSWPFGMYALFAGATGVVLVFAGFHIYLGVDLNKTVPGFLGYYLLGLLVPVILTLIGYACLKQQNMDAFGLSKVYNGMLRLRWRWSTRKARRGLEKQSRLEAAAAPKVPTIDSGSAAAPAAADQQVQQDRSEQQDQQPSGTVVVRMDNHYQQQSSHHVSRTGSLDPLVDSSSNLRYSSLENIDNANANANANAAGVETGAETKPAAGTSTALQTVETGVVVEPYKSYVWSVAVPGYFHPHHWQLFYILAFFTRFEHWVSRVGGGIVLGCYMQGVMAYGYDYLIEE